MNVFAPDYYKSFKCIADKCRHNCCIGWEIDIDEETLEFYKTQKDLIGKISLEDTPHFVQKENGRCPFLNDRNLCDIITNHGEDRLCQICRDHPRFRNFFESRTEIGLGLTCEAAARLILDNDFSLEIIGTDDQSPIESQDETEFFEFRNGVFKRSPESLKFTLPEIKIKDLAKVLKDLERLDSAWDDVLDSLKDRDLLLTDSEFKDPKKAKRLLDYFVFRHLHVWGLDFCVLCTFFIMCLDGDVYENARMFSSEIEYSDQNIETLIQKVLDI